MMPTSLEHVETHLVCLLHGSPANVGTDMLQNYEVAIHRHNTPTPSHLHRTNNPELQPQPAGPLQPSTCLCGASVAE